METDLQTVIIQHIRAADSDNVLPPHLVAEMAADLTEFVEHATLKFITGQAEHGGNLIDRDLALELQREHMDEFWYLSFLVRKLRRDGHL